MAETATIERNSLEWEQLRAANSVLMLRDMLKTDDPELQRVIYEQVCNQEFSHIPEVLDGDTRTHYEFVAHENKLYVMQPDGLVDWLAIHENGFKRAQKKAEDKPHLEFYAKIAETELEEAEEQLAMIEDGEPATMFVISLDGSDMASASSLKLLGRDPEKKRAYLRASVFENGRLHLYSETYDGLTVDKAKQILFEQFGVNLPADANSIDILKSRIKLTGAHHRLIQQISPKHSKNNYDFVLEQKDLLTTHMKNLIDLAGCNLTDAELACQADELRYDIMSSYKQQLDGSWENIGSLEQSISYAGTIERSAGTQFPGCDSVVVSQRNNLHQTGYLNTEGQDIFSFLIKKEFESKWCPNCLPKSKPGKKVKAWRKGDRIGCTSCGHEVDICTKKVTRQGKKQRPVKLWPW
ncbi:MAG TPA: hypothetical protein VLE51_04020 [Candidatus Saccharimonadales bacterium]|nr:hypothetical protein [Candidatus Saccharimonadales bacterium]